MRLSAPQSIFLNSLDTKFRAYVGGFGSGKTFVGCLDLLNFAAKHPGTKQGYFGSTYPSIRDIFYPTFEEAAEMMGFRTKVNISNREIHLYRNGFYYGTVICRSMDNPASIVGFKISRALVDEIDTLDKTKATNAWNKIIARMRLKIDGVVNGIGVTTTPEGFKFVYQKFADNPTESYSMVQASTYENAMYLPDDYIPSLYESYNDKLIDAYIKGEFTNLTSGTVYHTFDRQLNNTDEVEHENEILFVGMDFNVEHMAAIVHVKRDGEPRAVNEFTGVYDTPAMISLLKEKYPRNVIRVFPDATGKNRKSVDASQNDIALLKQAGFQVIVNNSNPAVKDRITATNTAFCNANGERKYKVNVKRCPELARCLEQQCYDDNGQPDKKSGFDHPLDAMGYFIVKDYPILRPVSAPQFRMFG